MTDYIQQESLIQCPYCWEQLEILVDCSIPEQQYTEDCQVCCRPIIIDVQIEDGQSPIVQARTEDE